MSFGLMIADSIAANLASVYPELVAGLPRSEVLHMDLTNAAANGRLIGETLKHTYLTFAFHSALIAGGMLLLSLLLAFVSRPTAAL